MNAASPTPDQFARPLVVVIDDDEDQRLLLRRALETRGYVVNEYESTEDALGWSSSPPVSLDKMPLARASLVLLDINLPGVSGIDSLRLIKENPVLRSIPVAMLTALGQTKVVMECVQSGAADYFVKPPRISEIMTRIDRLISDPHGLIAQTGECLLEFSFQQMLVRELKRAERSNSLVALVLGAIRKVSSAHQQLSEDDVYALWNYPNPQEVGPTAEVSAAIVSLQQALREYDIVAAFGKGQFAIVLPGAGKKETPAILQRIFEAVPGLPGLPALPRSERWCVLAGYGCYPEEVEDRLGLFRMAEQRLSGSPPESVSVDTPDEFVSVKTVHCQACGRHYQHYRVSSRRRSPVHRETDLRNVYETQDPLYYQIACCPHCGLACFDSDLKRIKGLPQPVFGWDYHPRSPTDPFLHAGQTIVPDELMVPLSPPLEGWLMENYRPPVLADLVKQLPSELLAVLAELREEDRYFENPHKVIQTHLLAREFYRLASAAPFRRARVAHSLAWLYRDLKQRDKEDKFLAEALEFYLVTFHFEEFQTSRLGDLELLYLIGEVSFRLGREANAVAVFEKLVQDPRVEANPSFQRMVRRRWYEARHEPIPAEE